MTMRDTKAETAPANRLPGAPRQLWIDLLRGFLMLAIVFDHTEICFTGDNIVPYRLYVPDVLMAFFFLSGYLFYKPGGFRFGHKMRSWLRCILMPYFIFTAALALPKAWLHGNDASMGELLLTILTGQGSWFIAALAVGELLLSLLLWLTRERTGWLLAALALSGVVSLAFGMGIWGFEPNWWHANEAATSLFYLLLGYTVHRHDHLGDRLRPVLFVLLLLAAIPVNVLVGQSTWPSVRVGALVLPSGYMVKNTLSVLLLYLLCTLRSPQGQRWVELLSRCLLRMVAWTGRRSLVYYFFSSGIPTALTALLARLGYGFQGCYVEVIIVFFLNYALISAVTWFVYRYLPWATGRR